MKIRLEFPFIFLDWSEEIKQFLLIAGCIILGIVALVLLIEMIGRKRRATIAVAEEPPQEEEQPKERRKKELKPLQIYCNRPNSKYVHRSVQKKKLKSKIQ